MAERGVFWGKRHSATQATVYKVNIVSKDKNDEMIERSGGKNSFGMQLTGSANSKWKFVFKLNSAYLTSVLICNL